MYFIIPQHSSSFREYFHENLKQRQNRKRNRTFGQALKRRSFIFARSLYFFPFPYKQTIIIPAVQSKINRQVAITDWNVNQKGCTFTCGSSPAHCHSLCVCRWSFPRRCSVWHLVSREQNNILTVWKRIQIFCGALTYIKKIYYRF